MHAKLTHLAALLRQYDQRLDFYPPLDAETICTQLATRNLPCCEEIVSLYTWANGTDEATSAPMFRDERFIRLDRALEEWKNIRWYQEDFEHYGLDMTKAIPFAELWGHLYVLYCGDVQQLHRPIIGLGDTFGFYYKSIDAMLDTCIGWWSQTPPDKDVHAMDSPIWYQYNSVDGDPFYIDRLNLSV